jgi:hypothetical protein
MTDDDVTLVVEGTDDLWKHNLLHVAASLPDRQRGALLGPLVAAAARLGLVGAFAAINGKRQPPSAVTKNKASCGITAAAGCGSCAATRCVAESGRPVMSLFELKRMSVLCT